jgi:hypothetical protein
VFATPHSAASVDARSRLRPAFALAVTLGLVLVLGAGSARAQGAEPAPPPETPAEAPEAQPEAPPEKQMSEPEPAKPAPEAPAAASPKNYVTVLAGTTLFYVANDGSTSSFLGDISIGAGYGRLVTPTVAVELDVVPTLIDGEYDNTVLVPGAVWSFSTRFYAAARFLVKIDPELNFTVFPGIGVVHAFSNGLGVSLELNVGSTIGKGEPDFAVALTPGVLYSF